MSNKKATNNKKSSRLNPAPAFKAQRQRTQFLNRLAGELNRAISYYYAGFKPPDLYHRIQKQFRKEPLNNRFLLLRQLRGMEINPGYKLIDLGQTWIKTEAVKKQLLVTLQTYAHPRIGPDGWNGYYHELLLFCWDKTQKPPVVQRQLSEWISRHGPEPEFEFIFPLPAKATHWQLCQRLAQGLNQVDYGTKATMGMAFAEAGSFDKKDWALVEKREEKKEVGRRMKVEEEVMRVRAKGAG